MGERRRRMRRARCLYCGEFVGPREFASNSLVSRFTPDTAFTHERMEWMHKRCLPRIPGCSVPESGPTLNVGDQ